MESDEEFLHHVVAPGDNLVALAIRYRTSVAALRRYNRCPPGETLYPVCLIS